MSTVGLRQQGLLVADQLLGKDALVALRHHVAQGEFRSVHGQMWDRVWRLWDGHPQRGASVHYDPEAAFESKGARYPTGTPMDRLIDAVRTQASLHTDIVGIEGIDWTGIYLCPWLYPVGSALSLHQDAARYTGSFTFFLHARWRLHWGGELLVYTPQLSHAFDDLPSPGHEHPWLSDDGPDEAMVADIATAISPVPNRLVLLGDDMPHRVARVDSNAGAHVRVSVAGFFLRCP